MKKRSLFIYLLRMESLNLLSNTMEKPQKKILIKKVIFITITLLCSIQ
jgi:hypothetical protein